MFIKRLSLTNFRTFVNLDMEIPNQILLLVGDNAQGKTSLLEAVYFFSTFTSIQTASDRQVINFLALEDKLPVCRMVADIERGGDEHRLEIRLILEQNDPISNFRYRKEILVDGVKKMAHQAIGLFNAVVFLPHMTRVIEGGPEERRRYMNLALAQVVPHYARTLSEYARILNQRNALLKQIAERNSDVSQLAYWDNLLAEKGAFLLQTRIQALDELESFANQIHRSLTADMEILQFSYQPAIGNGYQEKDSLSIGNLKDLQDFFLERLKEKRNEDLARGITTIGPHRDELRFLINKVDIGTYGSRGQIRSTMMSLKIGELAFMEKRSGQKPVLLLDETLAELDEKRRSRLLETVAEGNQTILTTTDLKLFTPEFTNDASIWHIHQGIIQPRPA